MKVIELYGNDAGGLVKVLFVPKDKFRRPEEMPELLLLPVDKQKGEDPLQYQMVLFFERLNMDIFWGQSGAPPFRQMGNY